MTEKEILAHIDQEAIRPGKLGSEELSREREIMRQVRMLGIPKKRPVIVQKVYKFRCPKCGENCMTIPESEVSYYLRVWKLLENKPLTDAQIAEFVDLCERGYRYVGLFCPNEECDGEFDAVIMDEKEWLEHLKDAEIGYEIVEDPR